MQSASASSDGNDTSASELSETVEYNLGEFGFAFVRRSTETDGLMDPVSPFEQPARNARSQKPNNFSARKCGTSGPITRANAMRAMRMRIAPNSASGDGNGHLSSAPEPPASPSKQPRLEDTQRSLDETAQHPTHPVNVEHGSQMATTSGKDGLHSNQEDARRSHPTGSSQPELLEARIVGKWLQADTRWAPTPNTLEGKKAEIRELDAGIEALNARKVQRLSELNALENVAPEKRPVRSKVSTPAAESAEAKMVAAERPSQALVTATSESLASGTLNAVDNVRSSVPSGSRRTTRSVTQSQLAIKDEQESRTQEKSSGNGIQDHEGKSATRVTAELATAAGTAKASGVVGECSAHDGENIPKEEVLKIPKMKKMPLQDVQQLVAQTVQRRSTGDNSCPACPQFVEADAAKMVGHLVYHLAIPQWYPYECPIEHFTSLTEEEMRRHSEVVHPEIAWQTTVKASLHWYNVLRIRKWTQSLEDALKPTAKKRVSSTKRNSIK